MDAGRSLLLARRRSGLTQRALAKKTGIAQPTIARIERGKEDPRVRTLQRLLWGCNDTLQAAPRAGVGVDRTAIQELLALSPAARLATVVEEVKGLELILGHLGES